jgi:hypothetical protein
MSDVINLKEVALYDTSGAQISRGSLTFSLSSTGNFLSGNWGSASLCNDGVTTNDAGCHSGFDDPNPNLNITFSCPLGTANISQVLSKVVVYNRETCCGDRILAFKMDFLGPANTVIGDSYNFTSVQPVYNITTSFSGEKQLRWP